MERSPYPIYQGAADSTAIDLGDASEISATAGPDEPTAPLGFFQFDGQPSEHTTTGAAAQISPTAYPDLSGTLDPADGIYGGTSGARYRKISQGGVAGKFLENKGFGWLLEVEDDEDSDKPLLEELDIDVKDIYYKIRCVLLPLPYFRLKLTLVRDSPDFWGPLMVVLAYSLLSIYGQLSVVSWILSLWLLGSYMVFFLARVLGGDVGYVQCLGVIGYCLIPLVLTGLLLPLLASLQWLQLAVKIFGVVWAVYSAGTLLCTEELQNKKPLLLYPVFLLYVYFLGLYSGV